MKFHNTNPAYPLDFTVLGKAYVVEPDGEVEIEPAHVPWVLRRGLQLEPAKPKPAKPAPVVKAKAPEPKAAEAPKAEAPKPVAPKAAESKAPEAFVPKSSK